MVSGCSALVEERDACGVGFIASLNNEPSYDILEQALQACTCMEHRGASYPPRGMRKVVISLFGLPS